MTGENNLCVSRPTPSEKSLSLACTDVCNQAKAPYVCDVNISPAEKQLFNYPAESPSREQWRAVGSNRNLLGWQDRQVPCRTSTRQCSPPRVPSTKFQPGLGKAPGVTEESPKTSPRTGSLGTPLFTPKLPCLLLQACPIANGIYLQNLPLQGCFCKLFYFRLQGAKGSGGQVLQGQIAQQGWIFQPRQDKSCKCKYKTNHVMPVTCIFLSHFLRSSPFSSLLFSFIRYCYPVPAHSRPFVAFQILSEIYPSSLAISFNSCLLLLKLKGILHVIQSHKSSTKDDKSDAADWGQLLLEWEMSFGSSAQENKI